ncbi:MAG: nucleotidyl transferase AbiEii/AbiGii toxin family protein [Anaerolineaceae bacterium]|nr:nucleotidyl transferase AbiEii/AbiGii toxin family protein [Anaerolineaceae bacterium]
MLYKSGSAFRQALEARLRTDHLKTGVPLLRLRKLVAFDRFLARLTMVSPDRWVLKGGLAMQLRLGNHARTTLDMDVLLMSDPGSIRDQLVTAVRVDLGDWFQFELEGVSERLPDGIPGTRFPLRTLLDGRMFEPFHVDIGLGDPIVGPVELVRSTGLLDFAGIDPFNVACYPVTQHLAEKFHAYTLPRLSAENSRVKDLLDILLLAGAYRIEASQLMGAIHATFSARSTHPIPPSLPAPPPGWKLPYRKLASEVALRQNHLEDGYLAAQVFLDPILVASPVEKWDPVWWRWSSGSPAQR